MQEDGVARAAALLADNRLGGGRFAGFPEDLRPADEAGAYRIQDALHARLQAAGRGPLAGRKIGCTTRVMQRYLEIDHPCAGGLFAESLQRDAGRFARADLVRPGVECEIAVVLARDLPEAAGPYDIDTVADAVESCSAAIELVDERYADYRQLDTATLIADDFFNAGAVVGPPVIEWWRLGLDELRGEMRINGETVGEGRGADILGHPLQALAWLAGHASARGAPLAAGETVLLGSLVKTVWIEAGDRVEVEIEGLGGASLAIA